MQEKTGAPASVRTLLVGEHGQSEPEPSTLSLGSHGERLLSAALEQLGGSTKFWETVVELLSDAVFLVGPDRRILYWNRAAEQLTGYSRGEVVGASCQRAVHCDVCEHRCGVFAFGDVKEVPLVLRGRDGRRIETVKNATVVRDADGNPILGIEVLRDVTEYNARERASVESRQLAEQQKALLHNVLDAVTEGVVGISGAEVVRFMSASAAAALGIAEADALGRAARDVVGEEIGAMVAHVVASRAEVSQARLELTNAHSIVVPLAVTVSPLELPDDPSGAMLLVRDLRAEERAARERLRAGGFAYGKLVSRSPRMREVFDLIDQVAPTSATILVTGESGTGKELVAREIHKRSRRASGPFHAVNCAAIASEILESEFFGHERGAFTGAVAQKRGRFEVAHTGTIFLDEVAELPLELQGKLLRVLEERSFERVGGTSPIEVDVRVIAATNRDLRDMVRTGRFREDLFYRLRVVPLEIPALRERMEDVELLADHFLGRIAAREDKPRIRLTAEALRLLLDYSWPGNVRELGNTMEYVAVVAKAAVARGSDLPRELRHALEPPVSPRAPSDSSPEERASALALGAGAPGLDPEPPIERLLGDERARIAAALSAARYRHGEAAAKLGMHRTTLYRKRIRYGL